MHTRQRFAILIRVPSSLYAMIMARVDLLFVFILDATMSLLFNIIDIDNVGID